MHEGVCLNCTLPICDDRDRRCGFVQIGRYRRQRRSLARKYRAKEAERIKADIIAILGNLIGQKAVDAAKEANL
jgi:hypothetical protein